MVEYQYSNLYLQDGADKQLTIEYDGGIPITNTEIHEEQFELYEEICSGKRLKFGTCNASSAKFRISNVIIPLKGKQLTITETLGGNTDVSFSLGKYKVHSDKPDANRKYRDITAYDAMYDILTADVTDWYNTILPNDDSAVTLREFRTSFFAYLGIEQEEITLINDDMVITRTVAPVQLSGKTVINAICEINGCFGHIGRRGQFQYIHLKEMVEGLYPSDTLFPSDDLFPADPLNTETISRSHYVNATYQDYTTAKITKLVIRKEEGDVGAAYPPGNTEQTDNCYIIQDNFLVYGKSGSELEQIAANILSIIGKIWYRPAHVEAKGNPCLEVGDGIKLRTDNEIIYTYILQRTLKGIQALRDTYDAEGEQYQPKTDNSMREDIRQLKGKANILTRTIEETRLEMYDMEEGLNTEIQINAGKIAAEVERSINQDVELAAALSIEADRIAAEVKRATEAEGALSASLSLLAGEVDIRVKNDEIITRLNLSTEKALIKAPKIDLVGIVEADEFISALIEADKLVAKFAEIEELYALSAIVEEIEADYVSVYRFDALEAIVENIIANYVRTEVLESDYATVARVESVESYIKRLLNDRMEVIGYFGLGPSAEFTFKNTAVEWGEINGVKVLIGVD